MNLELLMGVINNAALLLALGVLYYFVPMRSQKTGRVQQVIAGVLIGLMGIAVMLNAFQLSMGIVFDTRSILISSAGLFFGAVPTVIAAVMTSAYRIIQGGVGARMGVPVILVSAALGLLFRYLLHFLLKRRARPHELYLIGVAVHLAMLGCAFFLPYPTSIVVVREIWLPVMLVYPFGSLLLGVMLTIQASRYEAEETIRTAQQSLTESEQRFRALFEQAAVGVAQVDTHTRKFVRINQRYCDMLGYSAEELQTLDFPALTHPQDRPMDAVNMERLKNGEVREFSMEKRYIRKDGSIIWVNLNVSPMWKEGDTPDYHITVAQDITDRKQAEQKARETEEMFHKAVLSIPDAVLISRPATGELLLVNDAFYAITGFSPEEVRGKTTLELNIWLTGEERERIVEALRQKGETLQWETNFRIKTGEIIPVVFSARMIQVNNEPCILTVVRDLREQRKAEETITLQLAQMSLAQQMAKIGYWSRSLLRNEPEEWSPMMYALFGRDYHLDAPTLEQIIQSIHPEDRQAFLEAVRSEEKGNPSRIVSRVVFPDGSIHHVANEAQPQFDEQGNVAALFGISQDITDQIESQKALRESEELYRTVLRVSPDGIAITDLTSKILYASDRLAEMFGVESPDEAVGRSPADFVAPQDHSRIIADLHNIFAGVYSKSNEYTLVKQNGETFTGEINAAILPDSEGKPRGIIATIRDVSDRVAMEQALRQSQESLQTIIQTSPLAIIQTDGDGIVQLWNQAAERIFGWSEAEVMGKLNPIVPDDMQEEVIKTRQDIMQGKAFIGMETERQRKDGSRIQVSYSTCALHDADGKAYGIIGIVADITERKIAETALRESEERYQMIIQAAPISILLVRDGKYIFCNQMGARLLGYDDPAQVVGLPFEKTIDPAQMEQIRQREANAQRGLRNPPMELNILRPDGTSLVIESTSLPIQLADGPAIMVMGIDLTARKQAEAALRESENRFRTLFEQAAVGVGISETKTGKFVMVNRKNSEIAGYTPEELLHMNYQQFTHPDDLQKDLGWMERLWKGEIREYQMEKRYIRKDGEIIWVRISVSPLWKPGEEPNYHVAIVEDITQEKKAQEELRRNEALLQRIFDILPIGLWFADKNGRLQRGNPMGVQIWGAEPKVGPEEYGVFKARRLPSGEEIAPDDWALVRTINEGVTVMDEMLEIDAFDGQKKIILNYSVPVLDENGEILGAIVMNQDITARARAEEEIRTLNAELEERVAQRTAELRLSNQELEAFAYSVSHDLRAPLRVIGGYARIVTEDYGKELNAEARRLLDVIRANIERMDKLIADLLELARVTRSEIRHYSVDMHTLAQTTYDEIIATEGDRQIDFSMMELPEAYGDLRLLRQVWYNLLYNAIKYSRPSQTPRIEVGSYTEANRLVYYVRDNGIGFDPKHARNLFGPFQRLPQAEGFEGTGAGLAIVKRIVERHGGSVWAEGKPGEGATFYFSMPVKPMQ